MIQASELATMVKFVGYPTNAVTSEDKVMNSFKEPRMHPVNSINLIRMAF